MPKFAVDVELTDAEAVLRLRVHLAKQPRPKKPEFSPGDPVRLDNGCVGIVIGTDDEGCVSVFHLNEDGRIVGPSFGWRLTKLVLTGEA